MWGTTQQHWQCHVLTSGIRLYVLWDERTRLFRVHGDEAGLVDEGYIVFTCSFEANIAVWYSLLLRENVSGTNRGRQGWWLAHRNMVLRCLDASIGPWYGFGCVDSVKFEYSVWYTRFKWDLRMRRGLGMGCFRRRVHRHIVELVFTKPSKCQRRWCDLWARVSLRPPMAAVNEAYSILLLWKRYVSSSPNLNSLAFRSWCNISSFSWRHIPTDANEQVLLQSINQEDNRYYYCLLTLRQLLDGGWKTMAERKRDRTSRCQWLIWRDCHFRDCEWEDNIGIEVACQLVLAIAEECSV